MVRYLVDFAIDDASGRSEGEEVGEGFRLQCADDGACSTGEDMMAVMLVPQGSWVSRTKARSLEASDASAGRMLVGEDDGLMMRRM